MTPKRSAWIDGSVKPWEPGFYQTKFPGLGGLVFRDYFSGKRWESGHSTGNPINTPLAWRGLAEKPPAHPPSSKGGEK